MYAYSSKKQHPLPLNVLFSLLTLRKTTSMMKRKCMKKIDEYLLTN